MLFRLKIYKIFTREKCIHCLVCFHRLFASIINMIGINNINEVNGILHAVFLSRLEFYLMKILLSFLKVILFFDFIFLIKLKFIIRIFMNIHIYIY